MRELEDRVKNMVENGEDSFKISKEIESFIKNYRLNLKQNFIDSSSRGKQFLIKHTRFYDSILSLIYKITLKSLFKDHTPNRNSIPIVIVALGSYGRDELTVHSDIDLMVTFKQNDGYNLNKIIEKFVYIAWDSGLKLGHRVHEISEIEDVAKSDQTIKNALIESRKIIGSNNIWVSLKEKLYNVRNNDIEKFILDKQRERENIYLKHSFGTMEPDIKEGFGGLRDSHMLFWILNIIYKVESTKELSGIVFSENEFKRYSTALDFLYQIRTALHLSTKRKRDKIVLEDIPYLAEILSINSQTHLSQKLLQSLSIIHSFAVKNIRKVVKPYLSQNFKFQDIRNGKVAKNIFLIDNQLFISSNLQFDSTQQFLEMLNSIPDQNFKLNKTIFSLNERVKFQGSFDNSLVISLFKRKYLYPIIDILYSISVLDKIFSPFEKVMFLPQFDGYHKHPVDIHSIYNIRELEKIEDQYLLNIYDLLSKDDIFILKIASLFHDIGKGRVEEHSRVGVKVIRIFLKQFNLDEIKIDRVTTLIRYHTLMTTLAYHEDIYNEKIIFSFTSKMKSEADLKLLYLLTYADVKSVNSNSFNSYSKSLLQNLYENALGSFGNQEMLKESEKREKRENQIKNSEKFKTSSRMFRKAVLSIKSNLAFFKLPTDSIIELTKQAKNLNNFNFEIENSKFLSVKIMRAGGVSFDIAYFLSRANFLSVVSLDIFEFFDGIKYFQIDFSESVSEENLFYIENLIESSFLADRKKLKIISPNIKKDEVILDCEYSKNYIKLAIHTLNQNGLLAYLFRLFEDDNIDVTSSKTQTFKKRVKDTFLFNRDSKGCDKYKKLIQILQN